ncbi:hypothetical protein AB0K71_05760 [Streptomyces syringium]|uniref:hypothetical protein n=1 Tax=Streptomyces syringium TaxID=76729 RepID=UPI00342FE286
MAGEDVRRLSPEELAAQYYVAQARHARRAADRVQALWAELDRRDLTGSWEALVGPQVVRAVAQGQFAAASGADEYVDAVSEADDVVPDRAGRTRALAFAGRAADGRPLESLLYLPVITTKRSLAAGADDVEAMMTGLNQLLRIAASEVADAGRSAAGVSIAGQRTINGYIRVVNAPACARCIILAGVEYGWNRGFQRHPKCDCVHMPARLLARGRLHAGATNARQYFDGLSRTEQNRVFTAAGAQAIRDGAKISQVVNARRGIYTVGDQYGRRIRATREGTTRSGLFASLERHRAIARGDLRPADHRKFQLRSPRLLPEQIYRVARSRDEAIGLLQHYGYLGWHL